MSDDLAAGSFVRSALRLPALIEGSAVRTAHKKFNSVCKVLGKERKVLSRFEKGPHDDLLCTFGTEQGFLLAETVRDWMAEDQIAEETFLWCEQLGAEYALVCVMDGQIIKETFEEAKSVGAEVARLVNRMRARNTDFCIFLHNIEPFHLELSEGLRIRKLKRSVLDHVQHMKKPTPKLLPYRQAIARVASKWRIRAILLAGALAITLVIPGTWLGVNWWFGEMPMVDLASVKRHQALAEEYRDLLSSPDPSVLLPAIHRASLEFLTDPWFGKRWVIKAFEWTRETGQLKISTTLPKVWDGDGQIRGLSNELQRRIRAEAEARGWKVVLSGIDAIFVLPVIAEERPQREVDNLRISQQKKHDSWDLTNMAGDMKLVGELSPNPAQDKTTEIYRTKSAVLKISSDPWVTGGTAKWVGQRLTGAPLALDSVTLRALPNGSGGLVDGEISFSLIWRNL